MMVTIFSDYFHKQYEPVVLCNEVTVCEISGSHTDFAEDSSLQG
jgi:hypothetical protein